MLIAANAKSKASVYAVLADFSKRFELQRDHIQQIIDRELEPSQSG